MLWFRKKPLPAKSAADYLAEAEVALLSQLVDPNDKSASEPPSIERLHRRLLALERLHEVQSKLSTKAQKKPFFETPAGVAVLTGSLTLAASQAPALVQMTDSRIKAEIELLKPVVESIAKDTSMDLDTRLLIVSAIQTGETRHRTIHQIKADAQRRRALGGGTTAAPPEAAASRSIPKP